MRLKVVIEEGLQVAENIFSKAVSLACSNDLNYSGAGEGS